MCLFCLICIFCFFVFALYIFTDSNFLNSPIFFPKNESYSEKALPTKVEGFQTSLFNLSQTCEIAFTENLNLVLFRN